MLKPDFSKTGHRLIKTFFIPVNEWLLSTDYCGTSAYANERNVPGTPV